MAETVFDLNNLTLDDNNFETVPEGDYRFKVISHEISYYSGNSDKIPANTQQIVCKLEVPIADKVVHVKHTMNVYSKAMFAIRQFAEAIGLCGEKGQFKFDINDIDGKSGICRLLVKISQNGNEFNSVETMYTPSKAPAVTANDEAWQKYINNDGFVPNSEALPFE